MTPHTITLLGRRWFQRTYGNTYHTCQIMLDGKTVHKTPMQYGYGQQFEQSGWEWLEANKLVPPRKQYPNGGYEGTWEYAERHGITYEASAIDVPREKDL